MLTTKEQILRIKISAALTLIRHGRNFVKRLVMKQDYGQKTS